MKVLYVGDACTKVGPMFLASPFNLEMKGMSHHIWGQPLIDAMTNAGIEVRHLTNTDAISLFPRTVEELSEYDVVILSDCEYEVLALYPFWMESAVQPTTDRIRAIRDYAKQGGGLLMIGGWSSFEGFNRFIPKEGSTVLATIGDDEITSPLLVTWDYGKGRSAAFASDCSPHWATHFQPWKYYGQFWVQLVKWLAKQ